MTHSPDAVLADRTDCAHRLAGELAEKPARSLPARTRPGSRSDQVTLGGIDAVFGEPGGRRCTNLFVIEQQARERPLLIRAQALAALSDPPRRLVTGSIRSISANVGHVNARRTRARLAIAAELLRGRDHVQWGYQLSRHSGIGAGSMYPFLAELMEAGYLEDGWEDPAESAGKPPRRYYRVTEDGENFLRGFLGAHAAPAANATKLRWGIPRPVGD